MTEDTLEASFKLLQAAGFRAREIDEYKLLVSKSFQHLDDDYWIKAVEECINTRLVNGMPKIAEWRQYVRTIYDRMPKIGKDAPPRASEEHHMPAPTEKHVAAWRKMFGGPINFDQAPEAVLFEIMAAYRARTLRISKLATFFGMVPTDDRGVENAMLRIANPEPSPKETERKNELVRALISTPAKNGEAEREASVGSPPADVVGAGSSPPQHKPEPKEYSEEDLKDVPF